MSDAGPTPGPGETAVTGKPKKRGSALASFGWIISDQGLKVIGGAVIGIAIARHLGPEDYGRLGVALGLAGLGKSLVSFKLERIVQRDFARTPENAGAITGSMLALTFAFSAVLIAAISLIARLFVEDATTRTMTYLLAWMAVPSASGVSDLWFQSQGRLKTVTITRNVVWIVFLALRFLFIFLDVPVLWFALSALAEWFLTYAVIWFLFRADVRDHGVQHTTFDPSLLKRWVAEGWPAMMCALVTASADRVLQLRIQSLTTATATGQYFASSRLAEMWWEVASNAAIAVLPVIVAKAALSSEEFRRFLMKYASLSFFVSVSVAVAAIFVAPWVVPRILGERFQGSSLCLVILVWAGPPTFLSAVRLQYLLMSNRLIGELPMVVGNALLTLAFAAVLIPHFSAAGACASITLAGWISTLLLPFLTATTRDYARLQWNALQNVAHPIQAAKDLWALVRKPASDPS